jgi:hypothetical protein
MGVTISLDDFGTGYSSLAYLKRFPLDTVKVDRSFVKDIAADSDDASITRAVITMAHHLKLKVVAEGVETAEQLALLISHQCDIIQGYFFSRPLSASAFTTLLEEGQQLPPHLLHSGAPRPVALFVAVDGQDEVLSRLENEGHRVSRVADYDAAMQWFSGNLADVLVCAMRDGGDAVALLRRAVAMQPDCERILLVDEEHWNDREIAELGAAGVVNRILRTPVEEKTLYETLDEALARRRIVDDYSRLAHEILVAERQLVRVEEERRRLQAENVELQDHENLGYGILQEVVAGLPWPVIGIDGEDMIALVNAAAEAEFPGVALAPGMPLDEVLPELRFCLDRDTVVVGGRRFTIWTRTVKLGRAVSGTLLLLQRNEHENSLDATH